MKEAARLFGREKYFKIETDTFNGSQTDDDNQALPSRCCS